MFDRIYSARLRVDPYRQPSYAIKYAEIGKLYTSLESPYETPSDIVASGGDAAAEALFKSGCLGKAITGAARDSDYVYRIMSFSSLLRYTSPKALGASESEDANWSKLILAQDTHRDWMPLSWFLDGNLDGPRGFTWWTPLDILLNVFEACHSLGMPDDWVAERAVVLRRSPLSAADPGGHVPTILDGFDRVIFYATTAQSDPDFGKTISLEAVPLSIGEYEFVCPPLPVSKISVYIASSSDRSAHPHRAELRSLLPHLLSFYESLDHA